VINNLSLILVLDHLIQSILVCVVEVLPFLFLVCVSEEK
jgi:hypothetical protein